MTLYRVESTCGRLVPKPELERHKSEDKIEDDTFHVQDQIEYLRVKIGLRERYNKVMAEDLEESRDETGCMLKDLSTETAALRNQLYHVLNAEKIVVQNALRAQREYQLALSDQNSGVAIAWIDDKLFDITKKYNRLMYNLKLNRKCLEDAEVMIITIEKWPHPGSLPWEVDARIEFDRLENKIEHVKVKGEMASILNSKYYDIKFILREEGGRYIPILKLHEEQLRTQLTELKVLKKMRWEAGRFREEAENNLRLTEAESSLNHKERRRQMTKIKKAVEIVLASNANRAGKHKMRSARSLHILGSEIWAEPDAGLAITQRVLARNREKIADFQDKLHMLIEVTRVTHITEVPARLKTVVTMSERLLAELQAKGRFRDILLRQKGQLSLIQSHFRYTGQKQEELFLKRRDDYLNAVENANLDIEAVVKHLETNGRIIVGISLSALSILNRIDEGKRRINSRIADLNLNTQLKKLYSRLSKLVKQVRMLQKIFPEEAERDYRPVVSKNPVLQPRLLRVGSPPVLSDESDDDDLPDLKLPTREDMKEKNKRFIQQAILRRELK